MFQQLSQLTPIFLLIASNVFMTFAWYWHLKFPQHDLRLVILISWGIALIEYCLAVPANRIGYSYFSAAELKTIQEVITLTVFVVFAIFYLNETKDGRLVVVDGRQRLSTFFAYLNDEFPLGHLRILPELNGFNYSDLDAKLQANLEDFQLT